MNLKMLHFQETGFFVCLLFLIKVWFWLLYYLQHCIFIITYNQVVHFEPYLIYSSDKRDGRWMKEV